MSVITKLNNLKLQNNYEIAFRFKNIKLKKWTTLIACQGEGKQDPLKILRGLVNEVSNHGMPLVKMASGLVYLIRGFTECCNGLQEAFWCYERVCVCVCGLRGMWL